MVKRYIIDASVAIKWVIAEPFYEKALQYVQSDAQLIAPDLIKFECISALNKKIRLGDLQPDDGLQYYYEIIESSTLILVSSESLLERAYELSIELNHSIYDCFYLSAAERLQSTVVTADQKFIKRVENQGHYSKYVRWIEDSPDK